MQFRRRNARPVLLCFVAMPESYPSYRFGDCSVSPATREVRRGERLVTLEPKVFDLLLHLVENRTRVVGKDELLAVAPGAGEVADQVLRLAELAWESGCDGLVCSPADLPALRAALNEAGVPWTPGRGVPAGS